MDTLLFIANILVLITLSGLHFYWLFGGRRAVHAVVPTDSNGRLLFKPGKASTLIVASGLLLFAFVNADFANWIDTGIRQGSLRYSMIIVGLIFLLRAIGDFKYLGITKRYKQTAFALTDARIYTPLCIALAFTHLFLAF